MSTNLRVLVLGASGMLGNTIIRWFSKTTGYKIFGTVRDLRSVSCINHQLPDVHIIQGVDVNSIDSLASVFASVRPNIVVNCVGIVKQLSEADEPLVALPINSLLPHRLAQLAQICGGRLIHISTDCVFSGDKGSYVETDFPDATDLYGRSKLLGEVDYPNAITLRTSIIGHELNGSRSLINWFLSQTEQVKGYTNAVFSGLPTVEVARIIHEFVIPNRELRGLYHLSANPISKFELLSLVANVYCKNIKIVPDDSFRIDRSLNSDRFRNATGFKPDAWIQLIERMQEFH